MNAVSCLCVCENRGVDHFRAMRFFRVAFPFFGYFYSQKSPFMFRLLTSLSFSFALFVLSLTFQAEECFDVALSKQV